MSEIMHEEENLLVVSDPGFFCSIWWEQPTIRMIKAVYEARLLHEKKYPGIFVMMTLLKIPKVRSLSAEAREYTRETRVGLDVFCRADASVMETNANPLAETMARMVYAAINLMTRASIPHKIFSDRNNAFPWLAEFGPRKPKDLQQIVEEVLRNKKT